MHVGLDGAYGISNDGGKWCVGIVCGMGMRAIELVSLQNAERYER